MTYAPDDLMVCHRYVRARTGLPAASVGIVGDPDHAATGGYHMGNDDLARAGRLISDYSKRESPRDRPGSNAASALDIGDFRLGDGRTQRHLAEFEVAACQRGDPRARDIREVIYTPVNSSTVKRYDRMGIRSTGDKSHLTHGHRSFFRDSEGRRARPDNYLGLLTEFFEGTTKGQSMSEWHVGTTTGATLTQGTPGYAGQQRDTALAFAWQNAAEANESLGALSTKVDVLTSMVEALSAGGVTPAALVSALVAALADPTVKAMLAEAARQGAELAGDS